MHRSHTHGLDAGLATDTIQHHSVSPLIRGILYWSVAFHIASVIISSSTCTSVIFLNISNILGKFKIQQLLVFYINVAGF